MSKLWDAVAGPLVLVLVVGLMIYLKQIFRRGRGQAWERAAAELGMEFEETAVRLLDTDLGQLNLFKTTHPTSIENVVWSKKGTSEVGVFEYVYSPGSSTVRMNVAFLHVPERTLPCFRIVPRRFLSELHGSISIEGVPQFSRRYLIFGSDAEKLREVIGNDVRHTIAQEKGWSVEGRGEWLIVHRGRVKTEEVPAYLRRAESISKQLRVP